LRDLREVTAHDLGSPTRDLLRIVHLGDDVDDLVNQSHEVA
jgi:hypothetical protein